VKPVGESFNEPTQALKQGLVVERVVRDSDAEKIGFAAGDVILGWVRGDHRGLIESPFDLLEVEIEELPRGAVTLEGLTGASRRSWVWPSPVSTVQEGVWGIVVRPNFYGATLTGYQAGQAAATTSQKKEAVEDWQATAREARNQQLPLWLASWLWLHSAEFLAASGEPNAADRACQNAVEIVKGDNSATTMLRRACGNVFLQKHLDELAKKYYNQALSNLQESKPISLSTSSILTALGRIAYANDDASQGVIFVRQALQIQEQLVPESLIVASNLNRIGALLQGTGELDQSKEFLLRAVALREKLSPHSTVLAAALQNLGDTFVMRGDPDQAELYHLRALKLWQELRPGSRELAGCFVDLANSAEDLGELAKAEEYYRRALEIQKKLQPRGPGTAASLNNLGLLMQHRGQLAAAEEFLKQSLEIKQEISSGSLYAARTLGNLGDLLAQRGDLPRAQKYLHEALMILAKKAPGSREVGDVYYQLGHLATQQQNFPRAEIYFQKALAIHEASGPNSRETGDDLQILGDIAWKRGDAAQAEAYYLRALKIRENTGRSSYADTLLALAEVALSRHQWDVAAQRFEQGLESLERQTARLGGAEEVRAGFRAQHEQEYRAYVDLLLSQNQIEHAFEVLERSRARTLLETLSAAHVDVHRGADPGLIEQERSLAAVLKAKSERRIRLLTEEHSDQQVKAVGVEISDLTSQYQSLEGQIRISSPDYAALTQPQPLSAKQVQEQLLDPDTLLLEYSLGADRSHVFAVSRESLLVFELAPRKQIEKSALQLYRLLTARNRNISRETEVQRYRRLARADAAYTQSAAELSRMILAPVAQQIEGKRLLVIADGALHYIPFAALPAPEAARLPKHLKQAPLALHHEIVNLPSASVLAVLRERQARRQPAPKAVAVLADPVFASDDRRVKHIYVARTAQRAGQAPGQPKPQETDRQKDRPSDFPDSSLELLTRSASDIGLTRSGATLRLPRLVFTRREAEAIMEVTPKGLGLRAVDFDASRELAASQELARYRIVHFATHGLLDSEHPELSGLVLSLVDERGRSQDGFMQLQDIYNLDLPADLVVLSACETGLGKEISGEGLIGLTRGFMYAGATRVVSTLWKVNDFATAKLMKAFYKSMEQEGKRPAQALREAQLSMIQDRRWSAPYYWAGFTIQGEWK
jgi:CHAT domain-containing protein/Tfp pilus assembly protein PilF